ncbi:Clp protease N-terminal domain-containing protein [Streptomyces albidoflavus]|uniref:Clp protease N-terminal domain-containing protein n=1 Tax=Streptomyces albidoflavus TaxID=1886 RepID=UPI0033E0787C
MHRPLPTSDPGPVPAHGSPRPELANALAGARRRAQRDGDGQADTAHLLHALLEHDPASREAVDACEQGGEQLVKLLGLLVQRNIGYGLKWHGSVEDSGAVPMARPDGWSPAAAGALEAARERAYARGDRPAGPDLLAGLVADPECRAVQVMERAGVDRELLRRRLDAEPVPPVEGSAPRVGEQAGPIDVSALRRELGVPQDRPGPGR